MRYSNRKETNCVPLLNAGFEPGVPDTKSPADWMLADKPTELSRIKLKTWTRQPVPMISEHSAHLTPLSVDFRTWLYIDIGSYLLLISMLWHRQAIFKSKGDKLCSSAECRIRTRDPRHQIASRLNARWQTDWAIEDQAKNLNSTARPYDQRAFSPLDPTVSWLSHLALAIYIFVVVNFDALAQASDIQIERRQVVFLCWMQVIFRGWFLRTLFIWIPINTFGFSNHGRKLACLFHSLFGITTIRVDLLAIGLLWWLTQCQWITLGCLCKLFKKMSVINTRWATVCHQFIKNKSIV